MRQVLMALSLSVLMLSLSLLACVTVQCKGSRDCTEQQSEEKDKRMPIFPKRPDIQTTGTASGGR